MGNEQDFILKLFFFFVVCFPFEFQYICCFFLKQLFEFQYELETVLVLVS